MRSAAVLPGCCPSTNNADVTSGDGAWPLGSKTIAGGSYSCGTYPISQLEHTGPIRPCGCLQEPLGPSPLVIFPAIDGIPGDTLC